MGTVSAEALTPVQLLERYLQVKDGPEERAKLLLQHGRGADRRGRWRCYTMTKADDYRAALRDLPAADWEPLPAGPLQPARPAAATWSWRRPSRTQAPRRSSAAGPASVRTSRRRIHRSVSWRFAGWWDWARYWRVGAKLSYWHLPLRKIPSDAGLSCAGQAQNASPLRTLHTLAADPRWRIREAVAMALQRWGDADMPALLAEMADWARGNPWDQRAAAAALCEPRLLKQSEHAAAVLRILDEITATIPALAGRRPARVSVMRSRPSAKPWPTAGAWPSPRCRTSASR